MSMTREEAIERIVDHMEVHHIGEYPHVKLAEALGMALSALRPVSREQVEKVWRGEWVKCKHADYYVCNKCSTVSKAGEDEFCKSCGAPMTDEAVEIRLKEMEMLEGMKSDTNHDASN